MTEPTIQRRLLGTKYGVWHGDPGGPGNPANFRVFARRETAVDYWDGETDD